MKIYLLLSLLLVHSLCFQHAPMFWNLTFLKNNEPISVEYTDIPMNGTLIIPQSFHPPIVEFPFSGILTFAYQEENMTKPYIVTNHMEGAFITPFSEFKNATNYLFCNVTAEIRDPLDNTTSNVLHLSGWANITLPRPHMRKVPFQGRMWPTYYETGLEIDFYGHALMPNHTNGTNYTSQWGGPSSEEIITEIIEGLLEGLRTTHNYQLDKNNITNCVDDAEGMVNTFKDAFKEFDHLTLQKFMSGCLMVIQACKNIFVTVEECFDGIEGFQSIIQTFMKHDLKSIGNYIVQHIMHNGMDLIADMTAAFGDFKNGQYKEFAYEVGDLIYTILPPENF
jgi:hypothetical protein